MNHREADTIDWQQSPRRFEASKWTLFFDRAMTLFIKGGGLFVIAAVLGIFAFIIIQVLPLFRHATVTQASQVQLPKADYRLLGVDEWGTSAFVVQGNGALQFVDLSGSAAPRTANLGIDPSIAITALAYVPQSQRIVYGTGDGRFTLVEIHYGQDASGPVQTAQAGTLYRIGPDGARVLEIAYGDSGADKLAAAIVEVNGERQIHAATLKQTRSLLGAGKVGIGEHWDLTSKVPGRPVRLLVNNRSDTILVATEDGSVHYLERRGSEISSIQVFRPFADLKEPQVASMDFLLGDASVSFSSASGAHRVFGLFVPEGGSRRLFAQTKTFPDLPGPIVSFAAATRNRAFVVAAGKTISLRYGTDATIRWEQSFQEEMRLVALGGKYDRIVSMDGDGTLTVFQLSDPHPEASWHALFGKVWYDGYSHPGYEWQSTGGSDDFEPKLSLIPLIIGTLKGTFYAMLFSVPIAILAGVYTSQFLHPDLRKIIKPMMEIMASLPSVVLGFIAALWLAPLIETRIPSVIAVVILAPGLAVFFGWFWAGLPIRYRVLVKPGYEFLVFLPILLFAAWAGWQLGPHLERTVFSYHDPATGRTIADFRRWWPYMTGLSFEQRNSLVVGLMMGFAVVPIIFTLTEDALSNVPATLRSASLALGASRWQTSMRVIIPTASSGIFSACMIGLGRAVGETMIVVMATGNTPLMNFNIFSGMRTLSANIAVELPEAPYHGTLYRALFLGAVVLFVLTFIINSAAELLRQHLREKYKTV